MNSYHQLSQEERYSITALMISRKTDAEIARTLGRSQSTISRELARNRCNSDSTYRAEVTHSYATVWRKRVRRGFHLSAQRWNHVVTLLKEKWSPEQISGTLKVSGDLSSDRHHCILTLVERKSGLVIIKKMSARTAAETIKAAVAAIREQAADLKALTLDKGTEFHEYKILEDLFPLKCYFTTPYHSWERGSNENLKHPPPERPCE